MSKCFLTFLEIFCFFIFLILELELPHKSFTSCTGVAGVTPEDVCAYECWEAGKGHSGTCNADGTSCTCGEIKYLLFF